VSWIERWNDAAAWTQSKGTAQREQMRNVVRREALKALGAATIAASGAMSLGAKIAGAADLRYVPLE
jgi:hypothetical protein